MNIRFLFVVLPALTLSVFLIAGCKKKKGIHPKTGTITESVYASGHVKAEEQYKVYSTVPGILLKIHIKAGEPVRKDDTVFTIQNPVARLSVENSRLALQRAEENLKNIREAERQAELARNRYQQDSLMFQRQKKLWEQNIGTQVQVEQAGLTMKASKTGYDNALTQLNQTRAALRLDYETARNNVKISKENAEDYVIKSETDGKVYTVYPEEGEGITPQTVLAVIGKEDRFLIEIQVDENDISRVQLGQEIFVTMDSYKDSLYKGRVTKIYPIMDESTGTFTVEGVFTQRPPRLFPHVNLEANILTGRKENAMILPREYVTDDNEVLLESGQKMKVSTGLKNYDYIEITGGLKADQVVVKP